MIQNWFSDCQHDKGIGEKHVRKQQILGKKCALTLEVCIGVYRAFLKFPRNFIIESNLSISFNRAVFI